MTHPLWRKLKPKTAKRKKARKPPSATRRVMYALGRVWLWSPERAAAIARSGMKCERCGCQLHRDKRKGDVPEVHHIDGVGWTAICSLVIEQLLVDADRLLCLCKRCHQTLDNELAAKRAGKAE